MGALFSVMSYLQTGEALHIYFAGALIPVALIFDLLDGRTEALIDDVDSELSSFFPRRARTPLKRH